MTDVRPRKIVMVRVLFPSDWHSTGQPAGCGRTHYPQMEIRPALAGVHLRGLPVLAGLGIAGHHQRLKIRARMRLRVKSSLVTAEKGKTIIVPEEPGPALVTIDHQENKASGFADAIAVKMRNMPKLRR